VVAGEHTFMLVVTAPAFGMPVRSDKVAFAAADSVGAAAAAPVFVLVGANAGVNTDAGADTLSAPGALPRVVNDEYRLVVVPAVLTAAAST
jgi:hypothetical protein